MLLSKSDYMLYLRHPAWLWLKKHDKNKLPPTDEGTQALFDEGNRFEAYANLLFPDATKLGFIHYDSYLTLPARTKEVLASDTKTILQGRLEAENLTCIFDVLERVEEKEYDLTEIKASTKVKPEHLYDLAFQLTVMEKAGLSIRHISVIHVNTDYVRDGEIDPAQLTVRQDVTAQVRELMPQTSYLIASARTVLSLESRPDISPRFVNQHSVSGLDAMKDWLAIFQSLQPQDSTPQDSTPQGTESKSTQQQAKHPQDPFTIYRLCSPDAHQLGELEDQHISLIKAIPLDQARNARQRSQIEATVRAQPLINPAPIKEFLDGLSFPLYFFDYETFSSVIPQFAGCRPYGQYPFQYSLHVLDTPTSPARHAEYVHGENTLPLPGLLAQLRSDIGEVGTILAWNMSYEKGRNELMASLYPEYAVFLHEVNERMQDLMLPFAQGWYSDQNFFGSASIKKVLPVLVPELDYHDLAIGEGMLARRLWTETIIEGNHQQDKAKILTDLRHYCTLDTYAMVRIWEELVKM